MEVGISKDDMEFAFERHATSKIRNADDLETVKSMGFRGEALASIAAIANVEMISRTEDNQTGNRILVEGGKILEQEETASQLGTTITVNNLFFNTPVRYKFLKKDFTEAGYIEDAVTRIALANPNIAIKLVNGSKTIIQTIGNGDIKSVIYSIYGKEVAEGLVPVDYEYEDIKVQGVVGKPEIARSNRSYQLFFVNKRYIKDKTLSASAEQAFKGLLTIGKYGFLVLNVDIEPKKIDVNVHPTKLEIRWSEEQKVFKAVYHAIREGLLRGNLISSPEKVDEEAEKETEIKEEIIQNIEINKEENLVENNAESKEENFKSQTIRIPSFINMFKKKDIQNEAEESILSADNTIQEIYNSKNGIENDIETEEENKEKEEFKIPTEEQIDKAASIINMQKNMEEISRVSEEPKQEFDEMYVKAFGKLPKKEEKQNEKEEVENIQLNTIENISVFEKDEVYSNMPTYKYIGALFSTYIVIEIKDEIYIIDQHAAHERVMYEKVKKNFYSESEKDSQIMLLPDIITLSHKEKEIVKENTEIFKKAGFIFEDFGDNTIRLIGVPSLCMELDTKELFLQLLDEIDTVAITATQEKEDKFISTVACKAAVKANMSLDKEEVDNLMRKLLVLPNPFTCPHGRPTAIKMSRYEIERKFSRK
ncbi:MAG: DNA mismatch repair endonuclease MutL [Clostridia bacterium]|nr:DNA mismatch repair endonuclease MutL [Clostridia bacterium]